MAATVEFAEHGLAGARLNRLATTARASKERLYSYFASKEALFEAVVAQWIRDAAPFATPLRADDVPGYVQGLFDSFVADPQGARLQSWIELEATEGMFADHVLHRLVNGKLREIRRGQEAGLIDPTWHPMDLLVLLTDTARSLAAGSSGFTIVAGVAEQSASVQQRRYAAGVAARRLVTVLG